MMHAEPLHTAPRVKAMPPRRRGPALCPIAATGQRGRPRAPKLSGEAGRAMVSLVAQVWQVEPSDIMTKWCIYNMPDAHAALAGLASDVIGAGDRPIATWLGCARRNVVAMRGRHRRMLVARREYRGWFAQASAALRVWLADGPVELRG